MREAVVFGPGGHRNNLGSRHLADTLYLIHLKSADIGWMTARADVQAKLISAAALSSPDDHGGHGWTETVAQYHQIRSTHDIGGEDVALPAIRAAMMRQAERHKDRCIWGPVASTTIHPIPDRLAEVL